MINSYYVNYFFNFDAFPHIKMSTARILVIPDFGGPIDVSDKFLNLPDEVRLLPPLMNDVCDVCEFLIILGKVSCYTRKHLFEGELC